MIDSLHSWLDKPSKKSISTASPHCTLTGRCFSFYVAGLTDPSIQEKIRKMIVIPQLIFHEPYSDLSDEEILRYHNAYDSVYEVEITRLKDIELVLRSETQIDVVHKAADVIGYVPQPVFDRVKDALSKKIELKWHLNGGSFKYVDEIHQKVMTRFLPYGMEIYLTVYD